MTTFLRLQLRFVEWRLRHIKAQAEKLRQQQIYLLDDQCEYESAERVVRHRLAERIGSKAWR